MTTATISTPVTVEWDDTITCRTCHATKIADDFAKDSKGKHGHKTTCKRCQAKLRKGETIIPVVGAVIRPVLNNVEVPVDVPAANLTPEQLEADLKNTFGASEIVAGKPRLSPAPPRLSPAPHLRALNLPPRPIFYRTHITDAVTVAEAEALVRAAGWPDEGTREVTSTLNYLVRQGKFTVTVTQTGKVYAPVSR